jgi:hypothetical protein
MENQSNVQKVNWKCVIKCGVFTVGFGNSLSRFKLLSNVCIHAYFQAKLNSKSSDIWASVAQSSDQAPFTSDIMGSISAADTYAVGFLRVLHKEC